jgi:allophanate hydrolase subunit 2
MNPASLDVVSWGVAGSVRDAGRRGRAAWGASRGGAVDAASLGVANRLVGNAPDAGAIESSGGLQLRVADRPVMVAIAGAVAAIDVVDGPPVGWGQPVVLPEAALLRIGRLIEGTRVYLAVRGGLRAHADGVEVGADPGTPAATEPAPRLSPPDRIGLWPGPRLDWFAADAWHVLTSAPFHVTPHGDRVGVRLSGPPLHRAVTTELPSEGMVEGAVQVPPDGSPIVMLADHPVTGGYPVIAVVDPRDLGHLAQMPPGSTVRFRPQTPNLSLRRR